ncbi:MAG: hypothetical protein OXT69_14495 [Candidatus Poribacteria bacterium]|nr:hypothetical protein [Candidatus Poribacteria bacterium]
MTMRQRLAHIALGGVLVLSGMIASNLLQTSDAQQTASNIVKAREFHLVNEYGTTTAVIASRPDGLTIQNAAGKVAASIVAGSDGGNMAFFNARDQISVVVGTSVKQNGSMSIYNAEKKHCVFVSADEDGGVMSISNAEDRIMVIIGQNDAENSGLVRVIGENGSALLSVHEHGGWIGVFGKGSDKSRAVMGVNEYGNGSVSTWDKNGYRQR